MAKALVLQDARFPRCQTKCAAAGIDIWGRNGCKAARSAGRARARAPCQQTARGVRPVRGAGSTNTSRVVGG
jgi:hypothetical protein